LAAEMLGVRVWGGMMEMNNGGLGDVWDMIITTILMIDRSENREIGTTSLNKLLQRKTLDAPLKN
jgi:hypothetical protein